jgi:hypothetical protein
MTTPETRHRRPCAAPGVDIRKDDLMPNPAPTRSRSAAATALLTASILTLSVTAALAAWPTDPATPLRVSPDGTVAYLVGAVPDGEDGMIVVWAEDAFTDPVLLAQRLGPDGSPLWPTTGALVMQGLPDGFLAEVEVAGDGGGGCVVVVAIGDPGALTGKLLAQWVDGDGTPRFAAEGLEVAPSAMTYTDISDVCDVTVIGGEAAVIGWGDLRDQATTDVDIYAQIVTSGGTLALGDGGLAVCTAGARQAGPVVTGLPDGGVFVHWTDWRNSATTGMDLYTQRLDASGQPLWAGGGVAVADGGGDDVLGLAEPMSDGSVVLVYSGDVLGGARDLLGQRIDAQGNRIWNVFSGLTLCDADGDQFVMDIAADGTGGVIVAWQDGRQDATAGAEVYAQRIDTAGGGLWGANGRPVAPRDGQQGTRDVRVVPDGTGGATVLLDTPTGMTAREMLVMAFDAFGQDRWSEAARVTVGAGSADAAAMVADGAGGFLLGLGLGGGSQWGVFTARLDGSGYLGEPAPTITAVADYPQDQGGVVRVDWQPSPLDTWALGQQIERYTVWMRLAGGAPLAAGVTGADGDALAPASRAPVAAQEGVDGGLVMSQLTAGWAYVSSTEALALPAYTAHAPTYADSTDQGVILTEYQVIAIADNGAAIASGVVSGYSVDNLAPGAPLALLAVADGADVDLDWSPSAESAPDLMGYRIYRGQAPGFSLDPAALVATVADTVFTDADPGNGRWYYRVAAVDHAGNESGPSPEAEALVATAIADDRLPGALAWYGAAPNPFNPRTELRFALSRAQSVTLTLYDQRGRLVRTLADGARPAGEHRVAWDGRDRSGREVGAGVYLAVLRTEEGTRRGKLTLVR